MREILYRGKNKHLGWVYGFYTEGYYLNGTPVSWIEVVDRKKKQTDSPTVDPKTVGQYTGLTDKNGAKIFEGDIVNIGEHDPTVNGLYCVFYSTVNHCWALKRSPEYHHFHFTFSDLNGFAEDSEVVGNIHDNPELLEGVER